MKKMMMMAWACLFSIAMLSAQGVEEVTLVVSGDGATKEEATHVALRSAIEQAFGCFVSANTEILNDSLVKDEIVTISNGSVSSYEEINVTELDSALLSVTLRATVSVNKLISYAKSKGSSCELSGALLTQEKRMLEMNIANTKKALNHLFTLVNEYVAKNDLWEYTFKIENVRLDGKVTGTVTCKRNKNGDYLVRMIRDYIANISISNNQVEHLRELGFYTTGIQVESANNIPFSNGYDYSEYLIYADLSSAQELIQSIDKNIEKRACVLFTDNLGFVYPVIPRLWPVQIRRGYFNIIDISMYKIYPNLQYTGYTYPRREKESTIAVELQIPDQNLSSLSNIELIPYSDPRFSSLANDSRWQQVWQIHKREGAELNAKYQYK